MGPEDAREFEEWAADYDESVRARVDFPFRGYDALLERLVILSAVHPGCRVLDLGIGTGNLARRFVRFGCQVWGIDFAANMLARARAKLPQVRLANADLRGIWPETFPRRFDRLVSAYVFHHFDLAEKVALVTRLGREHCAADGRILLADISFPSAFALDKARRDWAESWDEESYWIADQAIPACERAGFSVCYEQVAEFTGIYVLTPVPTADRRNRE